MKRYLCAIVVVFFIAVMGIGILPDGVYAAEKTTKTNQGDKEKHQRYKTGEAIVLVKGESALTKPKAAEAMKLGDDAAVKELWQFDAAPQKKASTASGEKIEKQSIALVKSQGLSTEKLISKLKQNKNVLKAEPNYICKVAVLTNDTYADQQWPLQNTGQHGGTAGADVNVDAIWNKGKTGTKKVVAVIDSGVDYTHEDLKTNMWENPVQAKLAGEYGYDFYNADDNPLDDNGHGSHCAGIIGAAGNNTKGISGVNQTAEIMALKVFGAEGEGSLSNIIAAYHYVNKSIDLGVPVVAINNSWGSEEMDGESEILTSVMDMVGEKGAISVCAAGNESTDVDGKKFAPTNCDSKYMVAVAASDEKNGMAAFSNYGKEKVDLAAPGTNVLSTVSYPCFNPSIYGSNVGNMCSNFTDYNAASEGDITWGIPKASAVYTNGSASTDISLDDSNYFGKNGKSLKINVSGADLNDVVAVDLPYEINSAAEPPKISAMVKAKGPKSTETESYFGLEFEIPSYVNIVDVPADKEVRDLDQFNANKYGSAEINGPADYWNHITFDSTVKKGAEGKQQRKLVFFIECKSANDDDYEIFIDDLGISKENINADQFGKYDFFNGTSMAAPHVTGAAALVAETVTEDMTADALAAELTGAIKQVPALKNKVDAGGVLDLGKTGVSAVPKVLDAKVDVAKKEITLTGNNFAEGMTIKMGSDTVEAKDIKVHSSKKITVKDKGWMNKVLDITAANGNGSNTKKNVYLVKGKQQYDPVESEQEYIDAVATNGTALYSASSNLEQLMKYDPVSGTASYVADMDYERIFEKTPHTVEDAKLTFHFGQDLVFLDKKLYNIGELREGYIDANDEIASYNSDYRLMEVNIKTGGMKAIPLPDEYENMNNQTIAAYNGKLYVMGGYDYNKGQKCLSTLVKVYNPATKKWSDGPKLPDGRAAGRGLQVGNSLVYTLGYTDGDSCPENLIFNGKKWTTSEKTIKPYDVETKQIQGKTYRAYKGNIGLYEGGLLYTGIPTDGLGDTFIYHVNGDAFISTKYNHITKIGKESFTGTVVGDRLFGADQSGNLFELCDLKSGLVKVTAKKYKGGSIKGTSKSHMPGSKVTIKAVPKKGYGVKAFTVAGKKINGTTTTIRLTSNQTAAASFGAGVKKITLTAKSLNLQAGKTYKIKAKVAPSKAVNKGLTYQSSNEKYAAVSSDGTITAKKAGIGKTVKITVTAKDGSGVKTKCTVKIKK